MTVRRKAAMVGGAMLWIAVAGDRAGAQEQTGEPAGQPVLKTEMFESGQLTLAEAPAAALEAFLRDLNQRKDYDYAQHGGQAGPDSAYLWKWVQCVTGELQRRGYYFDDAGQLHQPGAVVPVR